MSCNVKVALDICNTRLQISMGDDDFLPSKVSFGRLPPRFHKKTYNKKNLMSILNIKFNFQLRIQEDSILSSMTSTYQPAILRILKRTDKKNANAKTIYGACRHRKVLRSVKLRL